MPAPGESPTPTPPDASSVQTAEPAVPERIPLPPPTVVAPAPPRRRWSALDWVLAAVVLGFAFLAASAPAQQRPVAAPGDRPRPARRQGPFRLRSLRAEHRTRLLGQHQLALRYMHLRPVPGRRRAGRPWRRGAGPVQGAAGDGSGGRADPAGLVRARAVGAGRRRRLGRAGAQSVADAAPDDRLVSFPGPDALFSGAPAPAGRRRRGANRVGLLPGVLAVAAAVYPLGQPRFLVPARAADRRSLPDRPGGPVAARPRPRRRRDRPAGGGEGADDRTGRGTGGVPAQPVSRVRVRDAARAARRVAGRPRPGAGRRFQGAAAFAVPVGLHAPRRPRLERGRVGVFPAGPGRRPVVPAQLLPLALALVSRLRGDVPARAPSRCGPCRSSPSPPGRSWRSTCRSSWPAGAAPGWAARRRGGGPRPDRP